MFAILFDLEGTLVQSIESDQKAVVEFRIKTKEKLVSLGIPLGKLDGITTSTLMRNRASEYGEENFSEKELKRFQREMDRFSKKSELYWANRSKIFSDTAPVLGRLKRAGYKMGIVTNTSREAANRILTTHKLKALFDVVVTRNDVKRLKPDPEGVRLALKKLRKQQFVFVGDSVHDSQVAKNAQGMPIIINRRQLKSSELPAKHQIRSLIEIPDLIRNVCDERSLPI